MFTWSDTHVPGAVKRYAFDWSDELGASDTIVSASAELVDGFSGGLTLVQFDQFEDNLSYVKVSGGTGGQTARIRGLVTTNNGETLPQIGLLIVEQQVDIAELSLQDLKADLVSLRTARVTLLTGGQIKEVTRDGRRIVYNVARLEDLSDAIKLYEDLIAKTEAAADTSVRPRYRALRVGF